MGSATIGVGEDDLVTGEAVALDLPPASIGPRMLSGLIDYVIVWVIAFGLAFAGAALAAQLDSALASAVSLIGLVLAWVAYPVTVETLTRGRSVGKLAVGLRTVRDDAGPITFRHALARGMLGVVEVYLFWGIPAVITSVINPRGKRLGDIVAGTYVVRDRVLAQLPPPGADAAAPRQLGDDRRHQPAPRPARDGRPHLPAGGPRDDTRRPRVDGPLPPGGGEPLRLPASPGRQPRGIRAGGRHRRPPPT